MHLEPVDGELEYVDDQSTGVLTVDVAGLETRIELRELQPLVALTAHPAEIDPASLSSALGFPVETFDGSPVYRGREPGLDLHYASLGDGHDEPLGIVSFGEVQPGRYAAALEAVLWPDSPAEN